MVRVVEETQIHAAHSRACSGTSAGSILVAWLQIHTMGRDDVRRHKTRPEQERAAVDECRRRYEALFGQPWDQERAIDWREWLARDAAVDADARDVLGKLSSALDAARQFFDKHSVPPIEQREVRQGLRVELVNDDGGAVYRFSVDPETLPPEAPEGLRSLAGAFFELPPIPATELLVHGCDATVEWQPSSPASTPPSPVTLRCRVEPPDGGSFALFLRVFVRDALEEFADHMARVRPLFEMRKRTPTWETDGTLARVAVVALFDRTYGPGQLIERRSNDAPADRLTDLELAVTSILCGNWPNMPANDVGWTAADIIDREARHMPTARETLGALRAAGFPVPRAFAGTRSIDLTGDPPGDATDA